MYSENKKALCFAYVLRENTVLFSISEPSILNEIIGLYAQSAKEMPGGFQRAQNIRWMFVLRRPKRSEDGGALLSARGHPIGASSSLLAWGSIGEQRSPWHTIFRRKV